MTPQSALPLTVAQWEALPDTSGLELLDGMVLTRAQTTPRHRRVATRLRTTLAGLAPRGLAVTTNVEVRLAELHRRRPDLLVIDETALDVDSWCLMPEQIVLAVEVVAPGTETADRKHKPMEYADADIAHYWRVETVPGTAVHTYRLGESCHYLETGVFREEDRVADPTLRWAAFDVRDLR
jgi:Uma2 family endonuclease